MKGQYWVCIIGPVDFDLLPDGADLPPRKAVKEAIERMIPQASGVENCWSGWDCDEGTKNAMLKVWNENPINAATVEGK